MEGLPELPAESERHAEAHASLGRLFDQRGAFRRRNGGAEQADRTLDISELARGQCEGPLRRRDPGGVRRGLRVLQTGGRHLARPIGVRLDEPQRFGDVRGILATAHAHLPVGPTGAKSYLRVSPRLAGWSSPEEGPCASIPPRRPSRRRIKA